LLNGLSAAEARQALKEAELLILNACRFEVNSEWFTSALKEFEETSA
jgi:hypothetical protein